MLSVRSGIIIAIIVSVSLAVWGVISWYNGEIEEAEVRGADVQVQQTNDATNKVAAEGVKHAEKIDRDIDSKPISDVDRMLKSFPVTAEDGSTSVMPTMGAYTYDRTGSGEAFENEPYLQAGVVENSVENAGMDEKVHEKCPTVNVWDDVLDMYIPVECEYDE